MPRFLILGAAGENETMDMLLLQRSDTGSASGNFSRMGEDWKEDVLWFRERSFWFVMTTQSRRYMIYVGVLAGAIVSISAFGEWHFYLISVWAFFSSPCFVPFSSLSVSFFILSCGLDAPKPDYHLASPFVSSSHICRVVPLRIHIRYFSPLPFGWYV